MPKLRKIRLECIDSKHYKFYEMTENGDGTFTANYGRIGTAGAVEKYSMSKWEDKYFEKKYKKKYEVVYDEYVSSTVTSDDAVLFLEKLELLHMLIKDMIRDSKKVKDVWYKWKEGVEKTMLRLKEKNIIDKTDLEFCNNIYTKVQNQLDKNEKENNLD